MNSKTPNKILRILYKSEAVQSDRPGQVCSGGARGRKGATLINSGSKVRGGGNHAAIKTAFTPLSKHDEMICIIYVPHTTTTPW